MHAILLRGRHFFLLQNEKNRPKRAIFIRSSRLNQVGIFVHIDSKNWSFCHCEISHFHASIQSYPFITDSSPLTHCLQYKICTFMHRGLSHKMLVCLIHKCRENWFFPPIFTAIYAPALVDARNKSPYHCSLFFSIVVHTSTFYSKCIQDILLCIEHFVGTKIRPNCFRSMGFFASLTLRLHVKPVYHPRMHPNKHRFFWLTVRMPTNIKREAVRLFDFNFEVH